MARNAVKPHDLSEIRGGVRYMGTLRIVDPNSKLFGQVGSESESDLFDIKYVKKIVHISFEVVKFGLRYTFPLQIFKLKHLKSLGADHDVYLKFLNYLRRFFT